MYIITREENQYDQYGEYFVAGFANLPSEDKLTKFFNGNRELAKHVLDGGGRTKALESTWYYLRWYDDGEQWAEPC